jgi:hypothetical protein
MSFTKIDFGLLLALCLPATIAPGAELLTAAEATALQTARQGAVVLLNGLWAHQREFPAVPLKISDAHGPQLLLSDKPEYVYAGNGIMLQEDVKPGAVRLYLYHVPQPHAGPKTISAVIQNLGSNAMTFCFLHYAFPEPGKNYQKIAKTGLIDFFSSKPESSSRSIPPGARTVIDPRLDATTVTTDDLVHGFYEFEINQSARITVFQRDPNQSSLDVIDKLAKLPRENSGHSADGAGRGLFLTSDLNVTGENGFVLNTTNGPMRLLLADGRRDRYILGRDSMDRLDSVRDSGNYGVIYRIHLSWRSDDGRGMALLITRPVGAGRHCSVQSGTVQVSGGAWPAGTVAVPADKVSYGAEGEMVILQRFPPPSAGSTGDIEILYSPPGASCMPTPMLLVPY